jgi:hypothetical protein
MSFLVQSLPRKILTTCLFEGQEPRTRQAVEALALVISRCVEQDTGPSAKEQAAIAAFPSVCFEHGERMAGKPGLARILEQYPMCALYAIYGCRSLMPILEASVMVSGEALCEYELWRRENQIPAVQPNANLRRALVGEPFWAFKYYEKTNDASILDEIREFCRANHRRDPGAALVWLVLNDDLQVGDHTPLLHTSPLYAYLADRLLAARGFELNLRQLGKLTPRWACHFALAHADLRAQLLGEAVLDCPGWTIEFIVRSGYYLLPAYGLELIRRCGERTVDIASTPAADGGSAPAPSATLIYRALMSDWLRAYGWYAYWNKLKDHVMGDKRMPRPVEPDKIYGNQAVS